MILALFLFGALQTVPMPVDAAVERVSRCGLGRATTREDAVLQETVLMIRPDRADDAQLTCVDAAADTYNMELPEPLQSRFYAIRFSRLLGKSKDVARDWFAARGMLARFPEYRRGDDIGFARVIEQLCGPEAAGAFQAPGGTVSFEFNWMERQMRERPDSETLPCLIHAIALSGLPVGFVGNEEAAP
jgi:hypothetical protein